MDFNDYGHITGAYWLSSDNDDSSIPEIVANRIAEEIQRLIEIRKELNVQNDSVNKTDSVELFSSGDDQYDIEDYDKNEEWDINDCKIRTIKYNVPLENTSRRENLDKKRFLIVALLITFIGWYEYKQTISVQYSSNTFTEMTINEVETSLKEVGFSHIFSNEIEDLEVGDKNDSIVSTVRIGWTETFEPESKFPANFPVFVTSHMVKKIFPPMDATECDKKDYRDVVMDFENAGFLNITVSSKNDIVTGFLYNDGEVESVTLGGLDKYSKSDKFRPDVDVVITYHTFMKNKH